MRRWSGIVLLVVLAFTLSASGVAAKGGASITAGSGPWHFGQFVSTFDLVVDWQPAHGGQIRDYWANVQCQADDPAQGGYAEWQSLSRDVQQDGWQFGPTPSWSSGGAHCTLSLMAFRPYKDAEFITSDSFIVGA